MAASTGGSFPTRELLWPDPDVNLPANSSTGQGLAPNEPSTLLADNISGLQSTRVAGFFYPQNVDDVREVVHRAKKFNRKIAMRGTAHCMSKANVAENALIIDFSFMKKVEVVDDGELVVCEPGAQWRDLINSLNPYGRSPRTMQSYSTFATGGSLSCNAHGITSDDCCASGVVEASIMDSEGVVHRCRYDDAGDSHEKFLLKHVFGGFGLFGIIVELKLRTLPNYSILADTIVCPIGEFPRLYESILSDEGRGSTIDGGENQAHICVKLARFNIITCETVQIFLFRRRGVVPSVSQLTKTNTSAPRRMSMVSQLLYKWLMPAMLDVRFQMEEHTASAMDWSDSFTCNELLFESAEPLARLAEPLFQADDTFILQEYFVPVENVLQWIQLAKPIFKDVSANSTPVDGTRVILLNTTIRVVNADHLTALPYSPKKTYAFVLYYRLCRNEESVNYLRSFCQRFIDVTLQCEGRFYLPYLHHYSTEQLLQSYPEWPEFIKAKEKLDPAGLFDSGWFQEYGLAFTSEAYQELFTKNRSGPSVYEPLADQIEAAEDVTELIASVTLRRDNSLRKLMNCVRTRSAFFSEFMVNVFNVTDHHKVESVLSRCCWNPRLKNDNDIYSEFKRILDKDLSGNLNKVKKGWRQLKQLSDQKTEFTDEIVRIMTRLGKLGHIQDICTIGDRGKIVRSLQSRLRVNGRVYVIHEEPVAEDDVILAVETGSNTPVGEMFECNFNVARCKFPFIPSECTDMVTMMQGLHHLDPQFLVTFLQEVERMLRPGGVFLVREHDLEVTGWPMIDAAHIVFNALTGVSFIEECNEIRAFRSLADWRKIITNCTSLEHTMLFEVQSDDPTVDVMMCFFKPPLHPNLAHGTLNANATMSTPRALSFPRLPFQNTIEKFPNKLLSAGRKFLGSIAPMLESLGNTIAPIIAPSPSMVPTVREMIRSYTDWIAKASLKLVEQTKYVRPTKFQIEAIPSELFYGFLALKAKVGKGKASMEEAMGVNAAMKIFSALFGSPEDNNTGSESEAAMDLPIAETEKMALQLTKLLEHNPNLVNHDYLLCHGFPEPIVDALSNVLPPSLVTVQTDEPTVVVGKDLVKTAADKLQSKIDPESWAEMSRHIDTIVLEKPELTFDSVLGRNCKTYDDDISPWFSLFAAFLGSSRFTLSTGASLLAKWYGVPELATLYKHAQKARISREDSRNITGLEEDRWGLSNQTHKELDEAILSMNSPIRHVTMHQNEFRNIYSVQKVVSAVYSGKNVTEIVKRELHRTVRAGSSGGEARAVVLENLKLPLDRIFSYGLTPLSVYFYGERTFTLTYISDEPVSTSTLVAMKVKRALEKSSNPTVRAIGLSRKSASSMLLNAFKVLEYLQVEILKDFSSGLENTPWYRFDLIGTMSTYFKIMLDTLSDSVSQFGLQRTVTSGGFITALVPGIVMSFVLAQVQLMALPVLWSFGEDYDTSAIKSRWLVHLSMSSTESEFKWPKSFDKNTKIIPLHRKNIVIVEAPVFLDFSRMLCDLSRYNSNGKATIIDMDGNDRIAMKIHSHLDAAGHAPNMVDMLKSKGISSMRNISTWRLCNDSLPNTAPREELLYSAVTVDVPELLVAISACDRAGIEVDQVFDYYG